MEQKGSVRIGIFTFNLVTVISCQFHKTIGIYILVKRPKGEIAHVINLTKDVWTFQRYKKNEKLLEPFQCLNYDKHKLNW